MTTSAAVGQLHQPSAGNDSVMMHNAQLVSASKVCFCLVVVAGRGGGSAVSLSNQREIKTVHGWLIKVLMRTCVTSLLQAVGMKTQASEDRRVVLLFYFSHG